MYIQCRLRFAFCFPVNFAGGNNIIFFSIEMERTFFISVLTVILCVVAYGKKADPNNKPEWAKKDIRDFSDADMERLLDQWEVMKLFVALSEISLSLSLLWCFYIAAVKNFFCSLSVRRMKSRCPLMSCLNISALNHKWI